MKYFNRAIWGCCLILSLMSVYAGENSKGAFHTGQYPNLFVELLGKSQDEVDAKINTVYQKLFYGNNSSERIYYPVEPDMAYIEDVNNQDVRSEGMSYGMMIAVQLDKKEEFDRLWKWAKTYMQHKSGQRKDYFAWSVRTTGAVVDSNSASDGEEWFVTALYFAAARWGNGEGIYHYQKEAQTILDAMLNKSESSNSTKTVTNMFNKKEKQVVFVPIGNADDFTDPSYHVPHFYQLWSKWANHNQKFWADVADTSRQFLKRAVHQETGLAADYSGFSGKPMDAPWGGGHDAYRFDAWRVAMNVAVDYVWFGNNPWAMEQSNRLLNFFQAEGLDSYVNQYTVEGKRLSNNRSSGHWAMNAVAALAATSQNRKDFVQILWDMDVPEGRYRYYDGILQMLALLQVSGKFMIYGS